MKSLSTYRNAALSALANIYDERETQNVVSYWFEQRLGLSRTDFVLKLEEPIDFPRYDAPVDHGIVNTTVINMGDFKHRHDLISLMKTFQKKIIIFKKA